MDAEMVLSMTSRSASKSNIKRSFRFKHGPERETKESATSRTEDQASTSSTYTTNAKSNRFFVTLSRAKTIRLTAPQLNITVKSLMGTSESWH